jgi:pheromone a factor receptor
MAYDQFKNHIESRSPFTASLFIRRIAISFIMTESLCLVCLFSVLSISKFESWTLWSAVHAEFSVINVVTSPDDVVGIQLPWWGIPALSIMYIFLSFVIGEEVRDASKWLREMVFRVERRRTLFPMVLPIQ